MKSKNVADELVEAMREAAAIAKGEAVPAATHHFPLPVEVGCLKPPLPSSSSTGLPGPSSPPA